MASESSSAMLDLNDADTEDTEAPSVTDDARDGPPLIMEHGYDIAVRVDAPMKQLSTLETFVTYRVRCVCARWPTPPFVRRRYNHFKLLHKRLSLSHLWVAPPPLPPLHTARQQLDRYSAAFVAVRTRALHAFLDRVAKHPIFTHCEDFRIFLTTPDEELDKVFKSENSALNLWGLSSAIYGSSENKPVANGARVKDPEWTSYAEYLTSLQQKLTTLCALTNKLHKGNVGVATEMMNMKRVCDAWSVQARGATSRAAAALALGAATRSHRHSHAHRAVLPLLAAYTGAHVDKIRQRDQLHAAYVSGTNASGEMHNKLEQCSEALRSELSDWLPKTRSEVKALLLELADSQVALQTQIFMNWEHALRLSQDTNVEELFKTVSKTAVQNLSPSKCRSELTPTETERDLDELENYSNDSDSLIEQNERVNERRSEQESEKTEWVEVNNVNCSSNDGNVVSELKEVSYTSKDVTSDFKVVSNDSKEVSYASKEDSIASKELSNTSKELSNASKELSNAFKEDSIASKELSNTSKDVISDSKVVSNASKEVSNASKEDAISSKELSNISKELSNASYPSDPLNVESVMKAQENEDFLSDILENTTKPSCSKEMKDSISLDSKPEVVSDPVKEFSDVDLS